MPMFGDIEMPFQRQQIRFHYAVIEILSQINHWINWKEEHESRVTPINKPEKIMPSSTIWNLPK